MVCRQATGVAFLLPSASSKITLRSERSTANTGPIGRQPWATTGSSRQLPPIRQPTAPSTTWSSKSREPPLALWGPAMPPTLSTAG